jgi:hypothetical protein
LDVTEDLWSRRVAASVEAYAPETEGRTHVSEMRGDQQDMFE